MIILKNFVDPVFKKMKNDLKFYDRFSLGTKGNLLLFGLEEERIIFSLLKSKNKIFVIEENSEIISNILDKLENNFTEKELEKLVLVHGDIRNFKLEEKFSRIILPLNYFNKFIDEKEAEDCLRSIKSVLAPRGKAVMALFPPNLEKLSAPSLKQHNYSFEEKNGLKLTQYKVEKYDLHNQVLKTEYFNYFKKNKKKWETKNEIDLRIFFPREIIYFLNKNDMKILNLYGDFDGREFDGNSKNLIIEFK